MKLIPKNWDNFQHYKHRSPPWIKLHKNLLDDMAFQRLPVASKALAPMLWLLASESTDGVIHKTTEEIAFRLRMTEKEVAQGLKPLIDNGFFINDSEVLAPCLQEATSETETETETEKETKTETPKGRLVCPNSVSELVWSDFLTLRNKLKAPVTKTVIQGLEREALKANKSLEEVLAICCERGWRGFKADWVKDIPQIRKELPLGTDKQVEEAYRIECGGDPSKARFNSYFEMRNFILKKREERKVV
jgi:hypothetical protein